MSLLRQGYEGQGSVPLLMEPRRVGVRRYERLSRERLAAVDDLTVPDREAFRRYMRLVKRSDALFAAVHPRFARVERGDGVILLGVPGAGWEVRSGEAAA